MICKKLQFWPEKLTGERFAGACMTAMVATRLQLFADSQGRHLQSLPKPTSRDRVFDTPNSFAPFKRRTQNVSVTSTNPLNSGFTFESFLL